MVHRFQDARALQRGSGRAGWIHKAKNWHKSKQKTDLGMHSCGGIIFDDGSGPAQVHGADLHAPAAAAQGGAEEQELLQDRVGVDRQPVGIWGQWSGGENIRFRPQQGHCHFRPQRGNLVWLIGNIYYWISHIKISILYSSLILFYISYPAAHIILNKPEFPFSSPGAPDAALNSIWRWLKPQLCICSGGSEKSDTPQQI